MPRKALTFIWRRNKIKDEDRVCARCGIERNFCQIDLNHIVDYAEGGPDEEFNLIPFCTLCHFDWGQKLKGAKTIEQFLKIPSYHTFLIADMYGMPVSLIRDVMRSIVREKLITQNKVFNQFDYSSDIPTYKSVVEQAEKAGLIDGMLDRAIAKLKEQGYREEE